MNKPIDNFTENTEAMTVYFVVCSSVPDALLSPVSSSNTPVRYYDLQGREVDSSAKGVIIVRQGDAVRKVIR